MSLTDLGSQSLAFVSWQIDLEENRHLKEGDCVLSTECFLDTKSGSIGVVPFVEDTSPDVLRAVVIHSTGDSFMPNIEKKRIPNHFLDHTAVVAILEENGREGSCDHRIDRHRFDGGVGLDRRYGLRGNQEEDWTADLDWTRFGGRLLVRG